MVALCSFKRPSLLFHYTCLPHPPSQSRTRSLTLSLIHSPTHSLTHSLTHPAIHSPTHSLFRPLTHPLTHTLTHSAAHPLSYSLDLSFIHSPAHPLTRSPARLLAHPLTHSPTCPLAYTLTYTQTLLTNSQCRNVVTALSSVRGLFSPVFVYKSARLCFMVLFTLSKQVPGPYLKIMSRLLPSTSFTIN
jgi:hypothetical protein